ncbi:MAG TPA: cytochrome c biogenesis protein CcsA [Candidatus Eisenbacteria bacterium]|nr:cytochrome c biogenesis protein CcsA [Candidatus Eisenbacteria bacterium]
MPPKNTKAFVPAFFLSLLLLSAASPALASEADAAKPVAIQSHGRIKSFDAFCRQWVETVSGRERWERRPSVDVVLDALAHEETIFQNRWIRVGYRPLAREFGLAEDRQLFSYEELRPAMDRIEALLRSAKDKRDKDVRPSRMEQEAESVYARLVAVHELSTGENIAVIPMPSSQAWQSPYQTLDKRANDFKKMVALFGDRKYSEFRDAAGAWIRAVDEATDSAHRRKIGLEIFYQTVRPFQWAWIFYLTAFVLLSVLGRGKPAGALGLAAFLAGFGFHTCGLALRVIILGRPPVSNMYESMVYMNWALILFAMLLWAFFRSRPLLSVASLLSALVMIYGNLLPIDAGMDVLVPVLRSNYWLTIHVMTIVASYGAFGLAMGLGHRHILLFLKHRFHKNEEAQSANLIYHTIQIGALLLGAGTILGGVWANESWGRFWGWDPKETWALITFLAYLIIIHLKFSKLISHFWVAVSSILGFLFVLMTWYGVNFVLGRGLHSYGRGSGGIVWILYYLAAEALFLLWVAYERRPSPRK